MADVRFINVPLFDEIAVKNIYKDVSQLPLVKDCYPDEIPKGCQIDRSYFFNIYNSKYPEQLKETIDHANKQRYTVSNETAELNAITITEEWEKALNEMPFISK